MLRRILPRGQMLFPRLLEPGIVAPNGSEHIEVRGLTADSRDVCEGFVFAALPGVNVDGAAFVTDAVARGAAVVLAGEDSQLPGDLEVPVLRVSQPRWAFARMAARYYERQPHTTVAVTGTSGKTSVAEFSRQIFASLGHDSASLGTIGLVRGDHADYGGLTTPDPVSLHKLLAQLAGDGVTHLALEASSHGLDQHRLDGVAIKAAAFTNLGRDHLDYHKDLDEYFAAKMRLFRNFLEPGQPCVINLMGARSGDVLEIARDRGLRCITVGREEDSDIRLLDKSLDGFTQVLQVAHGGITFIVRLPLIGDYQVENALVAAGLAIAMGEDPRGVFQSLEFLRGVKGRLEIVGGKDGGLAVVDYAHKPEALVAALDALRPYAKGRLICVFGCGGDRDRGKRGIMGQISTQRSDVTIVTDDNPRSEDASEIRAQILAEAPNAIEIGSRGDAIRAAVGMMGEGDVVLIAGKGHETGQIVGDKVLPFSDHEVLRSELARTQ